MKNRIQAGSPPLTTALAQMEADGLIRSQVDGDGNLTWTLTELGKTFQELVTEYPKSPPLTHPRFDVGSVALARDVVSPDDSGKVLIDVGPALRLVTNEQAVPDQVELGLLRWAAEDAALLEQVPTYPVRIRLDIDINRTRPRSKIAKAEFELVEGETQFSGLFDLGGRLCCYSALIASGPRQRAEPRWTICQTVVPQWKDARA